MVPEPLGEEPPPPVVPELLVELPLPEPLLAGAGVVAVVGRGPGKGSGGVLLVLRDGGGMDEPLAGEGGSDDGGGGAAASPGLRGGFLGQVGQSQAMLQVLTRANKHWKQARHLPLCGWMIAERRVGPLPAQQWRNASLDAQCALPF